LLEFDKDYIPLFISINDRINSMIIDNTLLGCSKQISSCNHYPYRAFSLIMQLFRNELTREVFPKQIHDLLDVDFNIPNWFFRDMLVGEEDQNYYHYGLKLDMSITEDSPTSIIINNFQYNNGYEFFPLNREITLTPQQAFFTFSNILLNDRCFIFDYAYRTPQDLLKISLENFSKEILRFDSWRLNRYGKAYKILNLYSFAYLKYFIMELQNNNLKPASLLHYSGARLLGYLRHLPSIDMYLLDVINLLKDQVNPPPLNSQVLYFTLLYNAVNYSKIADDVFRFLDDHTIGSVISTSTVTKKEFPKSNDMKKF